MDTGETLYTTDAERQMGSAMRRDRETNLVGDTGKTNRKEHGFCKRRSSA